MTTEWYSNHDGVPVQPLQTAIGGLLILCFSWGFFFIFPKASLSSKRSKPLFRLPATLFLIQKARSKMVIYFYLQRTYHPAAKYFSGQCCPGVV